MTDMNEMRNVDSLAHGAPERDATFAAMSLVLHEIQLRFDQLALLIEKSRQMQLPAAARTYIARSSHARSMRLSNMPNFAESNCSCPQCAGKS